jgi:hypothetical protein
VTTPKGKIRKARNDSPIVEKQVNDAVPSILMVEKDEKGPMHQPSPLLQLVQWG